MRYRQKDDNNAHVSSNSMKFKRSKKQQMKQKWNNKHIKYKRFSMTQTWKSIASILARINMNGSKNPAWKMDAKNVKNGHH